MNKAAYAFCPAQWRTAFTARMPFFRSVKNGFGIYRNRFTMLAPRPFKEFEIETGKSTAC